MLYRLEVENFYSIRDAQVMDLRVRSQVTDTPNRFAPLWQGASENAPKVVALFGPNASGKSNVLRALSFLVWFVRQSFQHPAGQRLPAARFNEESSWLAPARLAIEFGGPEDLSKAGDPDAAQCRYRFELEFEGGEADRVRETLYHWPTGTARRLRVFERDFEGRVRASRAFGLAGFRTPLEKILRPQASVISTLVQLGHPVASYLRTVTEQVLGNILIEKVDGSEEQTIQYLADHPDVLDEFNRQIERIDLGIRKLEIVQQGPYGPVAQFRHVGLSGPISLFQESHGTRQFLKIFPLIHFVLKNGGIAIIDELDSAIHPLLLPEILRWFQEPGRNPHDAQLWMSCHSASLLEELLKEEIFFCEKDSSGRTEVYALADIQAVRRHDNFYKKYLSGAYGAVPLLG